MSNQKPKRFSIGSIVKSKDPSKPDYIQIRKDLQESITLNPGDFLSVETVEFQKSNLRNLVQKGILSEENAQASLDRLEKAESRRKELNGGKDFVRADVFVSLK